MGPKTLIIPLIISQAFGLAVFAWAASDHRDSGAVLRLQMRQDLRAKFRGTLSCETITDANCNLSIIESSSGKRYQIKNDGYAMRLYQKGARDVLVDGELSGKHVYIHEIKSL